MGMVGTALGQGKGQQVISKKKEPDYLKQLKDVEKRKEREDRSAKEKEKL